MREVEVGVRIGAKNGLSFFGIDEVNGLIRRGGQIVALEPGGAIMQKLGEDADSVRLTLSGFNLKVHIQEAASDVGADA